MSGSRRENAYVNFDLHKKFSFLYFLYRFFCKCILKCLAQHRMRADLLFSHNFGEKMWLKEGHAEKKMFSNAISRSSKVNQCQLVLLSFLYPHWLSPGQK